MLFKQNEVPLRKSNKGKTWKHYFPTLPLLTSTFSYSLFHDQTNRVMFMFMISKGSPTLLFFMFTPFSHHTNCCT